LGQEHVRHVVETYQEYVSILPVAYLRHLRAPLDCFAAAASSCDRYPSCCRE